MPVPDPALGSIRSWLFVPGNRPERFDKACQSGAHAVIIDLEDAVPLAEKLETRRRVVEWLGNTKSLFVRTNAVGTDWFEEDLAACSSAGILGIVLPKAERVEDIARAVAMGCKSVVPLIETAKGIASALPLAQAPGVERLAFGSIDFQVDLNITGEGEELLYFRSQLVLASRLANIGSPVDGVSTAIDAVDELRADTLRSRRLGFGGKLCIHPKQVPVVNAAFVPSEDEIAWARRVVAAMDEARGAAAAVDGKMVDRPVLAKAREILAST